MSAFLLLVAAYLTGMVGFGLGMGATGFVNWRTAAEWPVILVEQLLAWRKRRRR